jgi:hypothetical protein
MKSSVYSGESGGEKESDQSKGKGGEVRRAMNVVGEIGRCGRADVRLKESDLSP